MHMTRERYSEGWAVVELRMVNQIQPKHRKWPPVITGTIDRDKYDTTVTGPYEHGVLIPGPRSGRPFAYYYCVCAACIHRVAKTPHKPQNNDEWPHYAYSPPNSFGQPTTTHRHTDRELPKAFFPAVRSMNVWSQPPLPLCARFKTT